MKGEIKRKYQDFINHVDFPMIIYTYEDNKVIAINDSAKAITDSLTDIRNLFEGKKFKFRKEILDNGCELFLNTKIYINSKVDYIDMDVSVLKVDNIHYVFMMFEKSYKNLFLGELKIKIPRIICKSLDGESVSISLKNELEDEKFTNLYKNVMQLTDSLEDEIKTKKISKYNLIEMMCKDVFIKINLMPIYNSKSESIGILGIYNHIVSKEKEKQIYAKAIKTSSLVTKIMDEGDTVFVGWLNDEDTTIQYITPNIAIYGYDEKEVIEGKITFKDIIYEEDYKLLKEKFKPKLNVEDDKKKVYEYRIKKKDGSLIWVHEESIPVIIRKNFIYNFSSLQEISSRKEYELVNTDEKKEKSNENLKQVNSSNMIDNLKNIFDALESIVLIIRPKDYTIKYANKKTISKYSINNECDIFEFLNLNSLKLVTKENYYALEKVIKDAIEEKQEKKALVFDLRKKEYMTVKAQLLSITDSKKEVVIIFNKK